MPTPIRYERTDPAAQKPATVHRHHPSSATTASQGLIPTRIRQPQTTNPTITTTQIPKTNTQAQQTDGGTKTK